LVWFSWTHLAPPLIVQGTAEVHSLEALQEQEQHLMDSSAPWFD
jgi:hypothetical protein